MDPNPRTSFALTADQVGQDGTSWIEVLPAAEKVKNGRWFFTIDTEDLGVLAASIAAQPNLIPVDYDHDGAPGQDGSTRAAGWFTGEAKVVRAGEENPYGEKQPQDAMWAVVRWTPRAVQEIRDGEFRRISAEWAMSKLDKKSGLATKAKEMIAATLTNRPLFKDLAPVMAMLDSEQVDKLAAKYGQDVADLVLTAGADPDKLAAKLADLLTETPAPPDPADTASQEDIPMQTDYMKILGLDETADPDQRIAAAMKRKDDEILTLTEQVTDLNAKVAESEKLNDRIADLEANDRKRDIDVILARGVETGRVLPAEKDSLAGTFADNVKGLKTLLAARPQNFFAPATRALGHGQSYGLEDPDVAAVAEEFKGADPVDPDGAKFHALAMQSLTEKGKGTAYTADEYMAEIKAAKRQLV